MRLLLSNQKRLLLGIGLAFVFSGACDRVQRIVAGPKLLLKSDLQSSKWWKKMRLGALQGFTGEFLKLGFEVSERIVSRYIRRLG
jgi:hypothetical protein